MRKLLLGTTAVVGAALIGATGASAQEAPTVRIGGYFDFQIGYVNDNADNYTAGRASRWDFRSDAEIHVIVQGKAANGLTYGARIEFQMDNVGAGSPGTTFDTDEMFAFVSSPTLGTLRFGDQDTAAGLMQVRPPTYVGFQNARINLVRQGGTRYMISPIGDGGDATKIVYLSPQFFGFDFGISFALNGGEGEREILGQALVAAGGTGAANLQRGRTTRENELTAGLRYRGTFGPVGVAASFAFLTAEANRTSAAPVNAAPTPVGGLQGITAYSIGTTVTVAGFTLGGEYTWGRYAGTSVGVTPLPTGFGDSRHWLLGAAYTVADVRLTANFGRGTQDRGGILPDHRQTVWGVGASYTLAPGWSLYAYYESVRDRNYNAAIGIVPVGGERNTQSLVIGTNLTF
jgi:predicted porin